MSSEEGENNGRTADESAIDDIGAFAEDAAAALASLSSDQHTDLDEALVGYLSSPPQVQRTIPRPPINDGMEVASDEKAGDENNASDDDGSVATVGIPTQPDH